MKKSKETDWATLLIVWGALFSLAFALFWHIWNLIAGDIPVVREILMAYTSDDKCLIMNVWPISRSWDPLVAWIFPAIFLLFKRGEDHAAWSNNVGFDLAIGIFVGLMFGLVGWSGYGLIFGMVGGLTILLTSGLAGGLVFGLGFGFIVGLPYSLPVGLLYFGIIAAPLLAISGSIWLWKHIVAARRQIAYPAGIKRLLTGAPND